MSSLFVLIAHNPDMGTQAQRGFLVAGAAAAAGHRTSVFLAGGAIGLLTPEQLELDAFGAPLRQHVMTLLDHGGALYCSEAAMASRGFAMEQLGIAGVMPAPHTKIVELTCSHDRALTFG